MNQGCCGIEVNINVDTLYKRARNLGTVKKAKLFYCHPESGSVRTSILAEQYIQAQPIVSETVTSKMVLDCKMKFYIKVPGH